MKLTTLLSAFFSLAFFTSNAQIALNVPFDDYMVLQRGEPIEVRGTAEAGEWVTVQFNGRSARTVADVEGHWSVTLDPMEAGGPYEFRVIGQRNAIILREVLVGEVWLCSGQSNMEWTVRDTDHAAHDIAEADYPMIRCFTVEKDLAIEPQGGLAGSWAVCSPATVGDFTAVGYYFARELWEELGVPVGIINSSWGGTDIEAWTSPGSYDSLPAKVRREYAAEGVDAIRRAGDPEAKEQRRKYFEALEDDPGLKDHWYLSGRPLDGWNIMNLPNEWTGTPLADDDGHVWFRREFELPRSAKARVGELSLGTIDDNDMTWINGKLVGSTEGHLVPRRYTVGRKLLRNGTNEIVVRVTDTGGLGGFTGTAADMWISLGETVCPLYGEWFVRPSVRSTAYGIEAVTPNPNLYRSSLYNAMINPLVGYRIRGVIWYQGENNAWNATAYRTLFPNMITDWRQAWGYEFPFYWVQLANFMAEDDRPAESEWAELREAQTMTLSLPRTGQAVIIDLGDAHDIHPRNKRDVGKRLAFHALAKDYGYSDIVHSGPRYAGWTADENDPSQILIEMDTDGSELVVRGGPGIEGFAVAGSDRVFHWAEAWIEGGKVAVKSDKVDDPVAVRYAWGNNPRTNLYNSEGLPAVPFRTDDWPGITK